MDQEKGNKEKPIVVSSDEGETPPLTPRTAAAAGQLRLARLLAEGPGGYVPRLDPPTLAEFGLAPASPPAPARPPASSRTAAFASAAAAPIAPTSRAANARASPAASAASTSSSASSASSSIGSGSSASVGSFFDDEDVQGRIRAQTGSRRDHRRCKFKYYKRRQSRSKYRNVYRCKGYPGNPDCKDMLYCSRERKCLHKSNFKDKDGRINLKNCADCRAETRTAKIKDKGEREAKRRELASEFKAVPFQRGSGAGRNAKGKKRRPAKKNAARKGKAAAGARGNLNGNETESGVETEEEPLDHVELPDERPGLRKRRREDESDDDDNYGANGKGGFSGFGGGNGAIPVTAF
ncbi:hypothetical protein HER10_EVM0010697 [Colletotrichum scovillei]|uniref:KH domain-containing protein n=1 Tax=Colletotrichum scovillei TaxID=1209932 RepID=A0A9P7QR16_9PEZI|nr:uncharacterized protein HER10_EVM0010697 [Colletotrichum scovillei]KAF4775456.1 hypothetical protein HER10_EVM0010697 [Colletotrichum scovillei]KAG7039059.1 KH domain-containing protein [Colletotrichum scovillei]KAG7041239.1 KH domain-containing protein [Colletotrichum scovillei]KAG7061271.1 KH domain-containing protein [Colletotrichum scovillei]